MLAGREARTARRDLSSGVLIELALASAFGPPVNAEEIRARYGDLDWEPPSSGADIYEQARVRHNWGRQMLVLDGYHETIAWLYEGDVPISQITLRPEDNREKHLMAEAVARQVNELGADGIILSTEAWQAPAVSEGDPRARMRATAREDREEVFLTYAMRRNNACRTWRSRMTSDESGITVGDADEFELDDPPSLRPVLAVWKEWDR